VAKKILVIDDEPHFVKMLKRRLESCQYEVVSAPNGNEGLDRVATENPDLIILDIMMPEMDGYTFVKELKVKCENKMAPIIVMTAKAKMKDLFEIEGVADYVVKPYDPDELLEKVKKLLG